MIHLERITKRYGDGPPAVEELTLDIPEGEIVIFVGPSGCGKTTTMKMINRIIEPSGGRILLEGEDVTRANPDLLRRRIGYVIQQIGLFPHQTILDNIAVVPRLLKWPEDKTRKRVDELLEVVSMDPSVFRDRYPKELSGGQRQRVGVARALAADPPVMLMDEPFGAIDPITRDRLQNEFLRLQESIRKTIVFVTHDIDEAIKMGDRIAILGQRAIVEQYDTPEVLLSAPANEFVANFIGARASLKRLNLARVRDYPMVDWPTVRDSDSRETALAELEQSDRGSLLVLDASRRPLRWTDARELRVSNDPLDRIGIDVGAVVEPNATLADALNAMLQSRVGCSVVVDSSGAYLGAIDMATIMEAAEQMRRKAHEDTMRDQAAGASALGAAG